MGKGPFIGKYRYEQLGNYWHCWIIEGYQIYHSVEHYYQSMKSTDSKKAREDMLLLKPEECARFGRKLDLVQNWELIKYDVMKKAIKMKFDQHEDLKHLLIATYPRRLYFCENNTENTIENSIGQDEWDKYNEKIHTELRNDYIKLLNY